MSGLEALGIAASIIQVADLGTKLSVKLFSFYKQFKDANESMHFLSSEIAFVSAILRELGDTLKDEESSKLCSEEAFRSLKHTLDQCRDVLEQIQRVTSHTDRSGKTRFQQVAGKFRMVLLEPSLDPLKNRLERLKSTMLLLLNVIMYAGQIRSSHGFPPLLQDQRVLMDSLLKDKIKNGQEPRQFAVAEQCPKAPSVSTSSNGAHADIDGTIDTDEPAEFKEYNLLIQKMLQEIGRCKYKLEESRHSRIKTGVLNIHSGEIMRFQLEYGHHVRTDHSLFTEEKASRQMANVRKDENRPQRPIASTEATGANMPDNRTDGPPEVTVSSLTRESRRPSPRLAKGKEPRESIFDLPLSPVPLAPVKEEEPVQSSNLTKETTALPTPYMFPATTVKSSAPIPGAQQHNRPRRRYEEIERMYKCGWNGCEKTYGTLNQLNSHVTMQSHGAKRTAGEFKEIRKEWKARKKEENAQRKAAEEYERAATQAALTSQVEPPGLFPDNLEDLLLRWTTLDRREICVEVPAC
ncbi:hypothetical protein AN9017.2 [Aspergillus nidulans FGSC A4]|uniref:C2H2 finger domain transcription factor (Eurofung) n=1 Tax=Emericella nidulans (strain FGSC A4 / ATCC 38163 / CBS 112.46 / NRRL 194 / M139) TaxID=227321 RepID=Q5ARR3_EMENI|nr:hypothetical protein [Aspergillus nidulans FGSC A4]EAA64349.1 hypothetical protein AN9017.2 [Aspergillus nidulans FGSC A4]CBF84452.1 TPA: Putative C2H2 finger domain transcription factor (Eurofung) [Aspergillus nidulans FGSC A4]|eukprot:XP_682286.1 hypothetical protein AN9017.2 [Aspergillus nidulans FGSC A4]